MSVVPFRKKLIPYTFFNVNYAIIGLTVLFFVLCLIYGQLPFYLGLSATGLRSGMIWQIVAHFFTETGIFGIAFNMIALLFFGTQVEREMGSYHYLIFYFAIGILSGLIGLGLFYVFGVGGAIISGSATTVFAVAIAFASFYPDSVIYLMGIVPLRAAVMVLVYIGLDLIFLFVLGGANSLVHLLGFLLAFLWMLIRYRVNAFQSLFKK